MSEDKTSRGFWESSTTIPFLKDTGYLGAGTNGAMPQKCYGFWIETEIGQSPQMGNEPYENVWVRVIMSEDEIDRRHNGEYLMYGDFESVEKVLSAMATANLHKTEVRPAGKFDGYMNRAQIDFDEKNTTEECIDGLSVRVAPGSGGGVDVSFFEPKGKKNAWFGNDQVIARLNADLSPEGWSLLATEFRRLRTWREECLNKIAASTREQEAASQAPGI